MTTEHDEALVERVALALARTVYTEIPYEWANYSMSRDFYTDKARAIIYPPAPPKTRLQVARELYADAFERCGWPELSNDVRHGITVNNNDAAIQALLAALALPAMEDNA